MMPIGREKFLIVIYGSYCTGVRGNCKDVLSSIVQIGNDDSRLDDFSKDIVENLVNPNPPPLADSPDYPTWVMEKTNYYLENADFNAIFILKGCNNITPVQEAEYILRNNLQDNAIIFFEKRKKWRRKFCRFFVYNSKMA